MKVLTEKEVAAIKQYAVDLVNKERMTWESEIVYITRKVAFNMRNLIEQLRKNYWGIFDKPTDPVTGKDKYFIPLTESLVEVSVKNIDLDAKDINFRAKNASAIGLTSVVRALSRYCLDKIGFGEYLDDMERRLAIDGTAVWRTDEYEDEDGQKNVRITPVDLLNFYIDPTAKNIQEAYRIMERNLMTLDEVQAQSDWLNTKEVTTAKFLHPNDPRLRQAGSSSMYVDVWRFYGYAPKYLMTGEDSDKEQEVFIHMIISGLETNNAQVHKIEEFSGIKPYEEFWYTRVPGRWYGRGIAEKVLILQVWLNTIINIRITRAQLGQLGLFKIRRGSGITPQMLTRLPVNGAILLNSMDDLEQLAVEEASSASYTDEQNIVSWARQVTSAFESVTGGDLPASTSATASSIQAQSAMSQFTLIKEGLGMALQRWMKRQALPIMFKNATRDQIIRILGDNDEIKELDEKIVDSMLFEKVKEIHDSGRFLDPEQVQLERQRALATLEKSGKERYVKLLEDLDIMDYDVQVYITNEEFDKSVMVQNLLTMLQTVPAIQGSDIDPNAIIRQVMDLMGLDSFQLKSKAPLMPAGQPQQGQNQNNAQQAVNPTTRPGGNPPAPAPLPTPASIVPPARTMEPS